MSKHFRIITSIFAVILLVTFLARPIFAQLKTNTDLIHNGDIVDVDVVGSIDFDWRGGLSGDGFLDGIRLPDSERVLALCRDVKQIAEEVKVKLSRILRSPEVRVSILDRSNRAVAFVDGAVRTPQRLQLRRPIKLSEVIVLAGGITDLTNGRIRIFRPANVNCVLAQTFEGNTNYVNIDIADLLKGEESANPFIYSGDIITVAEALPVYVIGAVRLPGQILLKEGTKLSVVLASAGVRREVEKAGVVRLSRRSGANLKFDIKSIVDRTSEDIPLEAYDIIEVEVKDQTPARLVPMNYSRLTDQDRRTKLPLTIVD